MEVKSVGRYLRISPRKMRIVVDKIRGKAINEAIAILDYSPKRGALLARKVLKSAVANAENNFKVNDIETLVVTKVFVDCGPTLKRIMPAPMGRAHRINKRTSHLTIVLEPK